MNKHYKPSKFHTIEADFSRSLFRIEPNFRESLLEKLTLLYGKRKANRILFEFEF